MKRVKFIHSTVRAMAVMGIVAALVVAAASPVLAAPPPNDDFEDSQDIVALPDTDTISTVDATTESTDPTPSCGSQSKAKSVWWSYTATSIARLEANTFESGYDTILSVWTGSAGAFEQVACNDDGSGSGSQMFFDAIPGQTYHFLVTSYAGTGGSLTFTLQEAPEDPEVNVSVEENGWANAITGRTTVTGEITCSRPTEMGLELMLVQKRDGKTYRGYGSKRIDCDGTEQWLATVPGDFEEGFAGIDVTVYSRGDYEARGSASQTLKLRACTLIGTLDDDVIRGTERSDTICSISGDDVVYGNGGNDQIRAYDGNDQLIGGPGNDILNGGYGKDRLRGEAGADTLFGDQDQDNLNGGGSRDTCTGGAARDKFVSCETRQR